MRYVVFDLETENIFQDVGSNNPADLSISVGSLYDSESDTYTTVTVDEIEKFWPIMEKADVLVGYNSDHFDIPLLNKYYPGDLSEIKSIDLLDAIRESLGRRLRLDSVAESTLNEKKSGNGLLALRWWREGKIDKVKQYCEQDVRVTKKLFEYALKYGHVKYNDAGKEKEIPINTSKWLEGGSATMTHSLPF